MCFLSVVCFWGITFGYLANNAEEDIPLAKEEENKNGYYGNEVNDIRTVRSFLQDGFAHR